MGLALPDDWFARQLHILKHEGPDQMLATLRGWHERYPHLEKVAENLAYLAKREGQMQYPHYQAQQWPIGSGMTESGHKQVMQVRLKGPGMHWEPGNVNPMLALRTAICNDRWDETWQHRNIVVQQRKHQQRLARTQQRVRMVQKHLLGLLVQRQAVASAPSPVKTTPTTLVTGSQASGPKRPVHPAANHPWRRRLLPLKPTC